ncbi:hypothetical protein SUGI_0659230 [Cryptomeria japonica]|nr:hypothetical protein SUGI_0659230 [Cryptomeria japonica]
MEQGWNLKQSSLHRLEDKSIGRKNVKCCPSPSDWKRLNFDGASHGNLGLSGFGDVVRDEDGSLVGATYSVIKDLGVLLEMDKDIIPRKGIGLFDIDTDGLEAICGIVEATLSIDRHWYDGRIYEIIMCLLVDVLPSKEACIKNITSFVRDVDADAVGSAIMEVEEEWANILEPFFNTIVYLSNVECSDSEDEAQAVAVALKAKKEEFMLNAWEVFHSEDEAQAVAVALKAKKEEFMLNAWEVFRVGVKNDDMDTFKWMMRSEESWLSKGSVERVALIGSPIATILRLI